MGGGSREETDPNQPFAPSSALAPQAGETRIVADEKSNSILVYSTYSDFKRMRELVQTLDVPQAQVVIEATVLEVDLNTTLETGVQFFLQSNGIVLGSGIPAGNQAPSRGGVLGVGTTVGNVTVDAVLRVLREITNLRVISSPYLTVVDGQSARLVIGDQIPFASTTQTSNNAGNVTVTQQVEILDTGVVLEITPRIHANNAVNLSIVQSVSTPSTESEANRLTPVVATRDISSQILAQSGHTILLGGMIQDRAERFETGTPGAADLPVIGKLFKQEQVRVQRTELLVLITPRVVRSSSEIDGITRLLHGVYSAQGQYDLKR
jgi:general secretion pathway protein D